MWLDLPFAEAAPDAAAEHLHTDSIHLWRIPYASSQGRLPLRALLAAYLDLPPSAVALIEGSRGKPRLAPQIVTMARTPEAVAGLALSFNWSHSGAFALIALGRATALGVDIERLGRNLRALEIARRFFDPAEAEVLAALGSAARDRAFIGLWCAKEALFKAAGVGLSFGLARVRFAHGDDDDWRLVQIDPALGNRDDWQLRSFAPAPGCRGALAWRGRAHEVAAFRPR